MPKPNDRNLIKREFATRLSRFMGEKGWSQSDLARAASLHLPKGDEFRRDNISIYVNGNALPRDKHLNAIAKALGKSPHDLIDGVVTGRATPMPYSMRPVDGEAGQAWLQVDMKVPMGTALAVLSLLNQGSR